jgi:hypothetical protein
VISMCIPVDCLTTLSVAYTMYSRVAGSLVSNKSEIMLEEVVVA